MRITNGLLHTRALAALQKNLSGLEAATARASTGLRVSTPSDDPVATGVIMGTDHRLAALDQYRRNIESAEVRLASEEKALDNLGNLLTRARELAVAQGTDTADAFTRGAARAEVLQLRAAAISLANTSVNGAYLFGGAYTDRRPVDDSGAFSAATPAVGGTAVEIGEGQTIEVTHGAAEVFDSSGVLASFDALISALGANDATQIRAAALASEDAFDSVQNYVAEVGARSAQLSAASENVDALKSTLQKFRSDIAEIDIETATIELVQRQTALQSALLATSKILTTSLADYL